MASRVAARAKLLLPALACAALLAGCNDAQPWESKDGKEPVSVAPAATSVPDEPAMPTNPGDALSPGGTTPDGDMVGTTTPDDAQFQAIKQDRAAMLALRTAVSIIEGCHSGRPSYTDCDEQRELGARDQLGIVFGDDDKPGVIKVSATPNSIRVTTRSKSGARFTVARSSSGDRFSCQPGLTRGACPDQGTWSW